MRRAIALAVALAALAAAPAAAAADRIVQAVDGTDADNYNFRWTPPSVTVTRGDTVTWRFAGSEAPHNVAARGTNWSFRTDIPTTDDAKFTFTTPGVYAFVCEVHATTMTGTVTVTDAAGTPPPPPPPPPPSEQPWANEQPAPLVLESFDERRPRLTRVRAAAIRHGARVRFRLSEPALVKVRFKRRGRTVKVARRLLRSGGAHRLTVRDRRMRGRYRLEVRATDLAGNRSPIRRTRLTVRG